MNQTTKDVLEKIELCARRTVEGAINTPAHLAFLRFADQIKKLLREEDEKS